MAALPHGIGVAVDAPVDAALALAFPRGVDCEGGIGSGKPKGELMPIEAAGSEGAVGK